MRMTFLGTEQPTGEPQEGDTERLLLYKLLFLTISYIYSACLGIQGVGCPCAISDRRRHLEGHGRENEYLQHKGMDVRGSLNKV